MSLPSGELQVVSDEARVGPALDAEPQQTDAAIRGRSLGQIAWRRLRRDKLAMIGGIFVIFLGLVAILANPLTNWYGQFPNTVNNFPPHDLLDAGVALEDGRQFAHRAAAADGDEEHAPDHLGRGGSRVGLVASAAHLFPEPASARRSTRSSSGKTWLVATTIAISPNT